MSEELYIVKRSLQLTRDDPPYVVHVIVDKSQRHWFPLADLANGFHLGDVNVLAETVRQSLPSEWQRTWTDICTTTDVHSTTSRATYHARALFVAEPAVYVLAVESTVYWKILLANWISTNVVARIQGTAGSEEDSQRSRRRRHHSKLDIRNDDDLRSSDAGGSVASLRLWQLSFWLTRNIPPYHFNILSDESGCCWFPVVDVMRCLHLSPLSTIAARLRSSIPPEWICTWATLGSRNGYLAINSTVDFDAATLFVAEPVLYIMSRWSVVPWNVMLTNWTNLAVVPEIRRRLLEDNSAAARFHEKPIAGKPLNRSPPPLTVTFGDKAMACEFLNVGREICDSLRQLLRHIPYAAADFAVPEYEDAAAATQLFT